MIISVDKAKQMVDLSGWTDEKIEMKLKAVELAIRKYTNNNFQNQSRRTAADIVGGRFIMCPVVPFAVGDTVQVSESIYDAGLFTVASVDGTAFTVVEDVIDEIDVLVTRVEYPADVVDCALNLLEWEKSNRAKVGVQSETLSRHSVTYFNMDGNNQVMGYPVSLMGALKPYRKVRC